MSELPPHNNPSVTVPGDSPAESCPTRTGDHRKWRGLHWLAALVGLFTIGCALLRFTLADSVHPLGILFYASPLSVLTAGSLFCLVVATRFRQWRRGVLWLILTGFFFTIWIQRDFRWSPQPPQQTSDSSPSISVLLWNIARKTDLTDTAAALRARDADVIALIEIAGDPKEWRQSLRDLLPDYDISVLGGGMALLVRGTAETAIPHSLGGGSEAREITATVKGIEFTFLVVDINANLQISREEALRNLATIADNLSNKRIIILGDFNTPPDSVWLNPLRQNHLQIFETCGRGYRATWPIPLPLIQLDQIWTNHLTNPIACEHYGLFLSDHSQVVAIIQPAQSVADPTDNLASPP